MSLRPGARLGPYEIVAALGAGGMGEVYRARDDRLDRFVAIKVLSPTLAATPERLERFRREARAVAALNHPHICAIYDIGTGDGDSPAYIAMELLEGETLHARLHRGSLALSEVVEIGTALAEALESAHAKGLVHRDIKPENIMLTAQGPKILDFGLAKPVQAAPAADEPTRSNDARLTGTGATVGTPAYMSPEQLRGEQLDARSDLFALGLVLYEAATGRPAFTGATSASVSAAILYDSPAAPRSIRPELPARLEDTILKALEKDRTLRCQSASELRADFKRLSRTFGVATPLPTQIAVPQAEGASRGPSLPPSGTAGAGPSSDVQIAADLIKRHRRGVALTALALVAAVGVVVALLPSAERDASTAGATAAQRQGSGFSLQNAEIVRLTTSGRADLPAISPEGRYVAYVQRDAEGESLWIRQTEAASNVQIVPPRRGVRIDAPTVTPDGNYVDYVAITLSPRVAYTLFRVPFLGGTPRPLADDVYSGIAWAPDGRRMAFVRLRDPPGKTELVIADYEGRNDRVLATRQRGEENAFFSLNNPAGPGTRLAWSPEGNVIAAKGVGFPGGVLTGYAMFVAVADGAVLAELPQTPPGDLAWIDGSSLLQARSTGQGAVSQLWRIAYPPGEVSRLTNDLDGYLRTSLIARDNRFAAVRAEERIDIWIGDSAGDGRDVVSGARHAFATVAANMVAWAGERLLYTASSANDLALFVLQPDEGTSEEIVPIAAGAAATADGRSIVYVSQAEATAGWIFKADADGRRSTPLVRDVVAWARLTRDGRVVFESRRGDGRPRAWVVPIDGGTPTPVTDIETLAPDVSPDGRRLAFISLNAASELEIVVCDFPGCDAQRRFMPAGLLDPSVRGSTVRFTPDGAGIAYASFDGQPNVWVQPLDGSAPRQLTTFTDGRNIYDFAWSRDGERLAVAHGSFSTDIVLFSGLGATQER